MTVLSSLLASFSGRPGPLGTFAALPAPLKMVPLVQGLSRSLRARHCDQEDGVYYEPGDEGCHHYPSHEKRWGDP